MDARARKHGRPWAPETKKLQSCLEDKEEHEEPTCEPYDKILLRKEEHS